MAERMLREQYLDKKIPVRELQKKKNEFTEKAGRLSSELELAKKEANLSYRLKCEIADSYKKAHLTNKERNCNFILKQSI